ncbi:MAG: SMC-Scp complex subunit ScpB [Planctomycetes bacterium]|nr:SMC-Scp complex subunit ScpB [Planctomycetota bacterium]
MDDDAVAFCQATDRYSSTATSEAGDSVPFDSCLSGGVQGAVLDAPADSPSPPPDVLPADGTSAIQSEDTPVLVELSEPQPADVGDQTEIAPAQIIEALLFASDTPLSAPRLAELVGAGTARGVHRHIDELNEKYAAAGLSFRIEAIARGYQMITEACYRPWLAKLDKHRGRTRLSDAALEALAIVAYRQPIIRADVEAIRGVACGDVLNRLREMGLIRIFGRAEVVGRPMLYGTTRKFLDVFGLADLDDLPPLEALTLRPAAGPVEAVEVEEDQAAAAEARTAAGA